ncbi:ESX secretion-associated protein EspG [Saccharopolyspora cebuensis]|uniref:ESX secretion-associated protein EspG n=1 Tax=Saccharopolyspora cebuensis TaxID=418759 RepID=A0ABV4CIV6_9PSEU
MLDSFTLPLAAADLLGEELRLDLRRFPFEVPHFAATFDERRALRERMWADLEQRNLAYRGQVEAEVEQALSLLDRAAVSIAVAVYETGADDVFRARVAAAGRTGVLAVQDPRGLQVRFLDVRGLARQCAELAPDEPAGRLEAASVLVPAEPEAPQKESEERGPRWLDYGPTTSTGGRDAERAAAIMALPVRRLGYFLVSGPSGQAPAIGFRDTEQGRYSMTTRQNQDGQRWNTFAGADRATLQRHLDEHLARFR